MPLHQLMDLAGDLLRGNCDLWDGMPDLHVLGVPSWNNGLRQRNGQ